MQQLDVSDQALLDFEAQHWKYPGLKETAIRDTFGCSATRYYQRLSVLLERQEAEEYAPQLVHRLRRQRDRRLAMSARRVGWATPARV